MKKLMITGVLALAFLGMMSFTNAPTPPADVYKYSGSYDYTWYIYNSCEGEYILVSGTVAWKRTRVNANGMWHDQYHYQYKNVTGTGLSTGAKYKANYTYNWSAKSKTCDYKSKRVTSWVLVGQGKAANVVVKTHYDYSWDCDNGYDYDYSSTTTCH